MDRDPTSLFAFRYSSSPEFSFFANRFAYREKKGKEKKLFPLVNKSFKKKKSYRVSAMYILLTLKTKLSI